MTVEQGQLVDEHRPKSEAGCVDPALRGNCSRASKMVLEVLVDQLLIFYDFPAECWRHQRTTNPIESTFAPVKARTDVTKGPGSREAALAMIYKLLEAAGNGNWRKANLLSSGGTGEGWSDVFVNGELLEGNEKKEEKDAA